MKSRRASSWALAQTLTVAVAVGSTGCVGELDEATGDADVTTVAAPLTSALSPIEAGVSLTSSLRLFPGFVDCRTLGCEGFAPTIGSHPPKRTRGSNSQVRLPRNIYFGDLDGDRKADIIQHDDKGHLLVSRSKPVKSEISHLTLPWKIDELVVGDFYGAGWDQVCAVGNGYINCYGIDATHDDQLRLFFKQPNPIRANEEAVVGDFDGDSHDQIFLYDPVAATFRMLVWGRDTGFTVSPTWTATTLSRAQASGHQFRAGDWTADGRTDLVARSSAGTLLAFTAATTASGSDTFSWSFSTVSNFIKSGEQFELARADEDLAADLVVHRPASGITAFYKVTHNGGTPPSLLIGDHNLPLDPGMTLTTAWSHAPRSETGSENRDDVFLFIEDNARLASYEPRWNSADRLHWGRVYLNTTPNNDTGWPAKDVQKTLFLKCKLSGDSSEPLADTIPALIDRIKDYYHEVTWGRIDLSTHDHHQESWIQMTLTLQEIKTMAAAEGVKPRHIVARECAKQAGRVIADWDTIVAFVNTDMDWGNSGKYVTLSGRPPGRAFDVWASVHEIGHALGLQHTPNNNPNDGANPYGNPWDPMSAFTNGFVYTNPLGRKEGPELSAGSRERLGAIPANRITRVPFDGQIHRVYLSALNRPATSGSLMIVMETGSPNSFYTIEYREPAGFDSGIPRATVLTHDVRTTNDVVRLRSDDAGTFNHWSSAERLAGETYTYPDIVRFRVIGIDPLTHLADIEVTPIVPD